MGHFLELLHYFWVTYYGPVPLITPLFLGHRLGPMLLIVVPYFWVIVYEPVACLNFFSVIICDFSYHPSFKRLYHRFSENHCVSVDSAVSVSGVLE